MKLFAAFANYRRRSGGLQFAVRKLTTSAEDSGHYGESSQAVSRNHVAHRVRAIAFSVAAREIE